MCGIGGIINLSLEQIPHLRKRLNVMNTLQKHRGPDGQGIWTNKYKFVGLAHRRLSIIDLETGKQPMGYPSGNWLTYNGEIYNYQELRSQLGAENFSTFSDTEVILAAYQKWGQDCVNQFRGMFAFALWDEKHQTLFCSRDRFGIKPFYYTITNNIFYFASEIKALLPFVDEIETDLDGFKDYLTFQFCLAEKTLFKGIYELPPAHTLIIKNGNICIERYWEVYYQPDFDHTAKYFENHLQELLIDSVKLHLRSDVPIGGYVSGGFDSSLIAALATQYSEQDFIGFTGKFSYSSEYDESHYAQTVAKHCNFDWRIIDITTQDFIDNIYKIIYHLDHPIAGPGSFPQYMVSKLVSTSRKVVLGGQGGDEIFGGYTRYLIAYFEQCIKGAINGTMNEGNFIVTYESIIPNLIALKNYKPLLQEFWREGLFDEMDRRYFRLINRAPNLKEEVNWEFLENYSSFKSFQAIFSCNNVSPKSYFDLMTHFDFKTLLPALLQVEDRVSMAHGIESRVPLLDHLLVEFAATIPSVIKFKDGTMKRIFKDSMSKFLPIEVAQRQDKMGFPVPLTEWIKGPIREFIFDIFSSKKALTRELINNKKVLESLENEPKFGRKIWGLLCLEIWQQQFHDQSLYYKNLARF